MRGWGFLRVYGFIQCYFIAQHHLHLYYNPLPTVGETERAAHHRAVEVHSHCFLSAKAMETLTPPGLTILVVDDEPGFAKALTVLLGRDGHTVDTAANGKAALRQIHVQQYDLILCDLRLPELDGPAFYHLLKTEAPDLHRRVIFLACASLNPTGRRGV